MGIAITAQGNVFAIMDGKPLHVQGVRQSILGLLVNVIFAIGILFADNLT